MIGDHCTLSARSISCVALRVDAILGALKVARPAWIAHKVEMGRALEENGQTLGEPGANDAGSQREGIHPCLHQLALTLGDSRGLDRDQDDGQHGTRQECGCD